MSKIGRVKQFITNNAGMKLLAAFLAIVTYYAILGATGFEIHYDVPLEVAVEAGVAVLEKDTRNVEVTFKGSPEDLRRLEQSRIKAVVRPKTTSSSGSERVRITTRDIKNAGGVSVVKIKPSVVTLTFDREAEKSVRVEKPVTTGTPLVGRAELEYEPMEVALRGPRLRLQSLETVSTEPVDVDGRVESFTRTIRVLSPSDKWVSEIEPAEITVHVRIITELVSHVWTNVPVLAVTEPESSVAVRFVPPYVNVTLKGRPDVIDRVKNRKFHVFANCRATDLSGTNRLPVHVYLPAGTEVTAVTEPGTVRAVKEEG